MYPDSELVPCDVAALVRIHVTPYLLNLPLCNLTTTQLRHPLFQFESLNLIVSVGIQKAEELSSRLLRFRQN